MLQNLSSGDSYRLAPHNTPNGSGVAGPILGYRDISGYPLPPAPSSCWIPRIVLEAKGEPPKSKEKQRAKPLPAPPHPTSWHVFRFAFSKALSAPGASAAVGPREPGGGVHGSKLPRQQLPRTVQYKHPLPPPRPIPTDVEKYKNSPNFCNNLVRITPLALCK